VLIVDVVSCMSYCNCTLFCFTVTLAAVDEKAAKNKQLPCKFCGCFLFKLKRHMERQHADEAEVATACAKTGEEKQQIMAKVINMGVFAHNAKVLRDGQGHFVVAKTSKKVHIVEDYVPCKFCLGFYVARELYRHVKRCGEKGDGDCSGIATSGRMLLEGAITDSNDLMDRELKRLIVTQMRRDRRSRAAIGDKLIVLFAKGLLRKLGPNRANDIKQRMRQLGRLKLRLAELKGADDAGELSEYVSGKQFDEVIAAVEQECGLYVDESGRRQLSNPTLALKLGHSLSKIGQIKRGLAIRNDDCVSLKQAEHFVSLHKSEFTDLVSSCALSSIKTKGNSLTEMPDEEDMRRLKTHQLTMMTQLALQLRSTPNEITWRRLAEVTLSRLVVFNARRGSEVADLLVNDYRTWTDKPNTTDQDFITSMSTVEKRLLNR